MYWCIGDLYTIQPFTLTGTLSTVNHRAGFQQIVFFRSPFGDFFDNQVAEYAVILAANVIFADQKSQQSAAFL
ncbi:MAG: hypothetical protein KDD19_01800 [Phaeodactylibacter sp.]|nr:hypothetical protein [Phaeodactylibacter sp.]